MSIVKSENVFAVGIDRFASDLLWHKISSMLNDDFEFEFVIVAQIKLLKSQKSINYTKEIKLKKHINYKEKIFFFGIKII